MPTYEYACSKCKRSYELREGFDAPTTHPCQECGKGTAKRVLYAPPVVFKGSGWYATDSRNTKSAALDSDTSTADTPAADAPAAATSSDSKSDTKPKSDSKPATSSGSAAAS